MSAHAPEGIWYVSAMKLHLNTGANQLLFTGYGADHVLVNGQRFDASLLLSARGVEIAPWAGLAFGSFTAAHFEWVALRDLDILLLGTGSQLRFPHPSLTRALVEARIGLEVMDVGAMCRTFNILAAEGRSVGAAVLIEPQTRAPHNP
jgi:uncharacterized protein